MKHKICKSAYGILKVASFILIVIIFGSCHKDSDTDLVGNWSKRSDFEGVPRTDAVGFTIGSKAYLGTGYDGDTRLKDFWEYNPETDFWQQRANLPGAARNGAVGFGTDTKGYIGTGYDGLDKLTDFYEYDPTSNTWTKKADFAGGARYGAVSFAIANKGYIGTGYDGNNTLKDFWQYNPQIDSWVQIISIGGSKRRDALAFVVDNIAYVATGVSNGSYISDFWAYDPSTGSWQEKRNTSNTSDENYDDKYTITGINGVAFTIGLKGYVALTANGSVGQDVWEYDPLLDLWEQKTEFEGSATEAVAFSVNNRGFVATGRNSSYYLDDIWEFKPKEAYDKNN